MQILKVFFEQHNHVKISNIQSRHFGEKAETYHRACDRCASRLRAVRTIMSQASEAAIHTRLADVWSHLESMQDAWTAFSAEQQSQVYLLCEHATSIATQSRQETPRVCTDTVEDFQCPITCCIMRHPVRAADGFFYEEAVINKWLCQEASSLRSPMTNEAMFNNKTRKNIVFTQRLERFIQEHPEVLEESNC